MAAFHARPAPRRAVRTIAVAAFAAALFPTAWIPQAHAQIRQCEGPGGQAVFTDRTCDDVGARQAAPGATPADLRVLRNGCARDVRELVWEVSTAIDRGDVNRLASVYHWAGMSGGSGSAIMERLQQLVRRPLLHVTPVVHRPPPRPWSVLDDGAPPRATAPIALRLDQLQPDGASSRTTFDLLEHFGCVWIAG